MSRIGKQPITVPSGVDTTAVLLSTPWAALETVPLVRKMACPAPAQVPGAPAVRVTGELLIGPLPPTAQLPPVAEQVQVGVR